ncbi:alanine racemase [Clostridia bacterium]|nr:alanine racemase [Clostridia bacterium]
MTSSKTRVWAEINTDALAHNISVLRECAGEADIIAIVKANAYGHDVSIAVPYLAELGIGRFGVATADEGLLVRRLAPSAGIMILGHVHESLYPEIISAGIIPAVCSTRAAAALSEYAARAGVTASCNIKVNTGMNRVGLNSVSELKSVLSLEHLKVRELFTHFSCADSASPDDLEYTKRQQKLFLQYAETARQYRPQIKLHSQNSAGTLLHRDFATDMDFVRTGIAMYGCCPGGGGAAAGCKLCGAYRDDKKGGCKLRPVMTVKSLIAQVWEPLTDSGVSYGRTYTTREGDRLCVVTAGYGDGFTRRLSDSGYCVTARGSLLPVAGRVTMDQTVVLGSSECEVGDVVTLYGGEETPGTRFDTAAALAGTISYELLCGISSRVPRVKIHKHSVKKI